MGLLAAWISQHKPLHLLGLPPAAAFRDSGCRPCTHAESYLSDRCMERATKAVHLSLQGLLRGAAGLPGPGRHRRLAWERPQGQVVQPLPAGGLGP